MDLNEKAQWHIDFNGGSVPVLETTTGVLVPESGIIAQWALEHSPNEGIQLIPSDPLVAAKMRAQMDKFQKTLSGIFPMILSRGQDVEKIEKYKNETLPIYEKMCTEANGKFLMGTDELTGLDIHCAPFWEMLYLMDTGVYEDVG